MADRTTKALLLAIAIGLWANLALQWGPVPVRAQEDEILETLIDIERTLRGVESDVGRIERGSCGNEVIC